MLGPANETPQDTYKRLPLAANWDSLSASLTNSKSLAGSPTNNSYLHTVRLNGESMK